MSSYTCKVPTAQSGQLQAEPTRKVCGGATSKMLSNRSRQRPLITSAVLLLSLLVWPQFLGAASPVSLSEVTDQGRFDLLAGARATFLHDPATPWSVS